jgi:hypothetical protein
MADNLVTFAAANPSIAIRTEIKRGPTNHPFLRGEYLNTNVKTIGVKNLSTDDINDHVLLLRNQIGRRVSFPHISCLLSHASCLSLLISSVILYPASPYPPWTTNR